MLALDKGKLFERLGYRPEPGQKLVHDSTARIKVVCAGTRFGKSYLASKEGTAEMMVPGARGWIVGPSYGLGEKEFRYIYKDLVETLKLPIKSSHYDVRGGNMDIYTEWGSILEVKSADNPASLLGEEVDFMILSEGSQLKKSVWERYLYGRLISRKGRCIIPTTPAGFDDFLYPLFIRGMDMTQNEVRSWQFATEDCKHIDPREIEMARQTLSPEYFEEQYRGKFVMYSGMVYKEWDMNKHCIDDFPIPPYWEKWRAIDYGSTNPFCCLWFAIDPDGCVYVYREHYEANKSVLNYHAPEILRLSRGESIEGTYIDPSAAGCKLDLAISGISTFDADNELFSGLERVRQYLRGQNNEVKFKVFKSCLNTIREFGEYCYPERKDNTNNIEKPAKFKDHAMDACLSGDSLIYTTKGELPIKDLVGKEFNVYCYSNELGRITVSKAKDCRITQKHADVYKITYDNGDYLKATADHPVMLRTGEYCQVKDLLKGDSLMPFYTTIDRHGHLHINLNNGSRKSAHRLVYEDTMGKVEDTWTNNVHHLDYNKLNNDISNLVLVTRSKHASIHRKDSVTIDSVKRKISEGLLRIKLSKEAKQRRIEIMKNAGEFAKAWHGSPEGLEWHRQHGIKCAEKMANNVIQKVCEVCGKEYDVWASASKRSKYCHPNCKATALRRRRGILPHISKQWNHKVEKIEYLGQEDVYNFEVEKYHNFVVNGVIVHNCRYFLVSRPSFMGNYVRNTVPVGSWEELFQKAQRLNQAEDIIGNENAIDV